MNVALAARAGLEIKFKIRKASGSFLNVAQRSLGQRSATEIRVQDHAGGIDDRAQRMAERLPKMVFEGAAQSVQGKPQARSRPAVRWRFLPADATAQRGRRR